MQRLFRIWLTLSIVLVLAVAPLWLLGRSAARGAFVLAPSGHFFAIACQRGNVVFFFQHFDMGAFRVQPLLIQTGSLSHDHVENLFFQDEFHRVNWGRAGARMVVATPKDYQGSPAFVRVQIPLWLQLAVALPAPLIAAHKAMRVRHRRKHGLCVACGYDLRASTQRCPECGQALSPALSQRTGRGGKIGAHG